MKVQDFAKYVNKWIAVSIDGNKILASGDSIVEVEKQLKQKKIKEAKAIIQYIVSPKVSLSPHGYI